jgi:hypothetical protein
MVARYKETARLYRSNSGTKFTLTALDLNRGISTIAQKLKIGVWISKQHSMQGVCLWNPLGWVQFSTRRHAYYAVCLSRRRF